MDKKTQINIWYIFLAIFGVVLLRDLWVQSQTIEAIPHSQFETYLNQGQIDEVVIGSDTIRRTFKTHLDGKTGSVTTSVPPDMAVRLGSHDITFTGAVENIWFTTLLSWVLPALVFVDIWIFFIRKFAEKQGMGGFMSIGVPFVPDRHYDRREILRKILCIPRHGLCQSHTGLASEPERRGAVRVPPGQRLSARRARSAPRPDFR